MQFGLIDPSEDFISLMLPVGDTNPDAIGGAFSGASHVNLGPGPGESGWTGFGPGDYSGGYTGEGDSIYWGASAPQQPAQGYVGGPGPAGAPVGKPSGFGPGFAVKQAAGDPVIFTGQVGSENVFRGADIESGIQSDTATTVTRSSGIMGQPPAIELGQPPAIELGNLYRGAGTSSGVSSGTASTGTTGVMGQPPASSAAGGTTVITLSTTDSVPLSGTMVVPGGDGSVELVPVGKDAVGSVLESSVYAGDGSSVMSGPSLPPADSQPGLLRGDTPAGPRPFVRSSAGAPSNVGDPLGEKASVVGDEWGDSLPDVPEASQDIGAGHTFQRGTWKAGDIELEAMGLESNSSVSMLEDGTPGGIDPQPPFNLNELDFGNVPPETLAALSDVISDPASLSIGSDGLSMPMSGFSSFFRARAMDLSIGTLLMPIFKWIDKVSDTPWVSRGIQIGLASVGAIVGGDPFGLIAAPVMWGIQEYMKQRQRLIENDDPEAEQGKKFGYVREGTKWYPAILTSRERDEGWIGSNKTQIRMAYGTDIRWKLKKGTGQWVPYFEDGTYKMKDFHVGDNEVDDPNNEGGKLYGERVDPLRDFYFMSDDETTEMLRGMAGGDTMLNADRDHTFTASEQEQIDAAQKEAYGSFAVHDQTSWRDTWAQVDSESANPEDHTREAYYTQWGGYVDTLQDLRQSLDFMQDYRYSDEGQMQTSNFGENEFEGSRALRRAVNDGGYLGDTDWDLGGGFNEQGSRPKGWDSTMTSSMVDGNSFQGMGSMKILADTYVGAMNDLYDSQKAAGTAMGYNQLYGNDLPPTDPRDIKGNGWALYQDNTWAFGPLDTAQQLHGALELIEESGDGQWAGTQHYRSTAQRSFLAQKAYTRYLYSKIDKLGGLPYLNGDTNPNENFWESLPRDNDKDRVQYSDGTKVQWGRNPMYSELDDQGDSWTTYPPPGRSVTALGGSGAYDKRSNINWEYVLHDAGVLGDDPLKDPDYVAGRFKGIDDWMEYLGDEDQMFFDMVSGQYVLPGQETEHTVWNPETQTYVADHDYYWDDGKQELVQVGDESPGYQWNPETLHFEKPPGPVTDSFAELAKDDLGVTAEDLDAGLGAGQEIDEPDDMGPVIPDGYMLDDDGHLVYTPETAAEKDAEYATYLADAAAAAAAADAAAAQKPQVTPDETDGAGHVHADPYIAPTHELHHFAPDPTVPGHIPVDLIATQAAQGVKVI